MRRWVIVALLGLGVGPRQGWAQETQEAKPEPPGTTTYDFEDDLVTGDLVRPDGELLNVRRRGGRSSLIRLRTDFVRELLKSVEDL
jgi:hypothetical protein